MRHEIEPHIPLLDREQDYHADRMWAGRETPETIVR